MILAGMRQDTSIHLKSPILPTEVEIDQSIACLSKKVGIYCQILKDTGARCGEIRDIKMD
jgi:hypothetical protein